MDQNILIESVVKILFSILIGGLVGFEREVVNRPAGLRTHILVCVGASLVMDVNLLMAVKYSAMTNIDPTRLGAQVISGIGFLGAGTIIKEGATVKGLTTAASLWTIACLGLLIGSGYFYIAGIATFFVLFSLKVFSHFEKKLVSVKRENTIIIKVLHGSSSVGKATLILTNHNCNINKLLIDREEDFDILTIRYTRPKNSSNNYIIDKFNDLECLKSLECTE